MRVLDLFSGIGGFSLGLERAGMQTVAFCEIDPYCRRVLAKHWPDVPIYDDVRTLTADALRRDGIAVDLICGGFPCQDLSFAGKRAGLEGARSGLWGEYRRLIGELRPRFVIVENVPGLLSLGMATVLGDLAALGYDATWDCLPASAIGAPHRRDRVWIVAHTDGDQLRQQSRRVHGTDRSGSAQPRNDGEARSNMADTTNNGLGRRQQFEESSESARHVADADSRSGEAGLQRSGRKARTPTDQRRQGRVRNADLHGLEVGQGIAGDTRQERSPALGADWWLVEPDVGRVAHGVPARVDRLKALGNAVVPQIPEIIGRAIMEAA